MPLCWDSPVVTVLIIVLLIYALSPIEIAIDKSPGRRNVDDVLLLILLAVGITVLVEGYPVR